MVGATRVLLILSAAALVQMSWLAAQEGSWTDRLGLRFRDDCQEDVGLTGLLAWVLSWASGRRGQQRNGHCESKEMRCADGTKITGLQVRYARVEASDRDLYDFRPRCGTLWQSWLGMRFPSESDHMQTEGAICPAGSSVTGVQVARGRNERRDWDYYTFKLRCGKHWGEPLGLPFDGLRETRSATCPSGSWTAGLRVHRGFQDWGDLCVCRLYLVDPLCSMLADCSCPCATVTHTSSNSSAPCRRVDLISLGRLVAAAVEVAVAVVAAVLAAVKAVLAAARAAVAAAKTAARVEGNLTRGRPSGTARARQHRERPLSGLGRPMLTPWQRRYERSYGERLSAQSSKSYS